MLNDATNKLQAVRGHARHAARRSYAAGRSIPLGRAYREDCRAYGIQGTYAQYAEAYDEEMAACEEVSL